MILQSHHLNSRFQNEKLLDVEFGHRYTSKTVVKNILQIFIYAVYKSIDFNWRIK